MTNPNVMSQMTTEQLVAIIGVDVVANTAIGQTRQHSQITIDTRYLVGSIHVVPVVGEQWFVKRLGMFWALDRKVPFNTDTLATVAENPEQGLSQLGGATGPTILQGSLLIAQAPLQFATAEAADIPEASTLPVGAAMWDSALNKMVVSDGTDWRDTMGNIVLVQRAIPVSGHGGLTVVFHQILPVLPFLAGHGAFTPRAAGGRGIVATISGHGALHATTKLSKRVDFAGVGVLVPAKFAKMAKTAASSGHGSLSAVAIRVTAYTETNVNRTNQASPTYHIGCWVTLIGAGGAGGSGVKNNTDVYGASGGGGGAKVDRVFVPAGSVGPTYSIARGTGGASATATGAASTFATGGVSLSAEGGSGGHNGSGSVPAGGAGGRVTVSGLSVTSHDGSDGAAGVRGTSALTGGDNATGAGAGGGGGGGYSTSAGIGHGERGGNATTVNGGAGGATAGAAGASASNAAAGIGGAGGGGGAGNLNTTVIGDAGDGGLYGGGGGGGGSRTGGTGSAGGAFGAGGHGYSSVEWLATIGSLSAAPHGAGALVARRTYMLDTFDDPINTLLETHTPNIGGAWSKVTSHASDMYLSGTGAVFPFGASARYRNDVIAVSADYEVSVVITVMSQDWYFDLHVGARCAPAADTYYSTEIYLNNGTGWQMFMTRMTNSTSAQLGPTVNLAPGDGIGSGGLVNMANGSTHTVTTRVKGSTITSLIDGVQMIQQTDTGISAAGYPMIGGSPVAAAYLYGLAINSVTATETL